MKKIVILGSTGSIGRQSIEVAALNSIKIEALSANTSVDALEEQARIYSPSFVAMTDENSAKELKRRLSDTSVKVFSGMNGLLEMINECSSDTLINALVGVAGLLPAYKALECGMNLATANKESLVCAGSLLKALAKEKGCTIIPIDSEHSAVWQCLSCGRKEDVKRLILTASGGPFFGRTKNELLNISPADALNHPTWKMGKRITIDSATMMNKGFEIIEAAHLFDVPTDRIDVLVHKESIVHSMVEFIDGAVIAQMGLADMRTCISLALSYPKRKATPSGKSLDLAKIGNLSFYDPDDEVFPLMNLARMCFSEGGTLPAVLNAADEAAVKLFLEGRIKFTDISDIIIKTVHNYSNTELTSVDGVLKISDNVICEVLDKYS